MRKTLDITDEQRELVGREIENGLEFAREILNDPSILDHIPDGSTVKAIPIAERDPAMYYDIETPRYLAIVTPPAPAQPEPAARPNGRTRRIDRDAATRLKRIRAAHR
jgi:hypothetical protein